MEMNGDTYDGRRSGEHSFTLDEEESALPTTTPAPAAAGRQSLTPTLGRLADRLDGGVDLGGVSAERGDLGVARRAIAGLMSAVPETNGGGAMNAPSRTSTSGLSEEYALAQQANAQGLSKSNGAAAEPVDVDEMSVEQLREAVKAQRKYSMSFQAAMPAPTGNVINLDEVPPIFVNNKQAAATIGGPAGYARQHALNQHAAAMASQPQPAQPQPAPNDVNQQLLSYLMAMMSAQQSRGEKSSKLKSIKEQLSEFAAEAPKLGGQGLHDTVRWVGMTKDTAGNLSRERGFMTKVRTLFVNETAKDFDTKQRDQDGKVTTNPVDYLHKFSKLTNKAKYRDSRRRSEANYQEWKAFEDTHQAKPINASTLASVMADPEAMASLGQGMVNPHPYPDYSDCFDVFCKLLIATDYVLTADQHRLAFPPILDKDLQWKEYKAATQGNGKGRRGQAKQEEDTMESFNDRWDARHLKVQETVFRDCAWFGTVIDTHMRYEMLPELVREHIQQTPGAWPQTAEDWNWDFIMKFAKPFVDNGGLEKASKLKSTMTKLRKTVAAIQVAGVKSQRGKGAGDDVCAVRINGKTVEIGDNSGFSKAYRYELDGKTQFEKKWKVYDQERRDWYFKNKFKLVNGKPVPGKNQYMSVRDACARCLAVGHEEDQCPGTLPAGTVTREEGSDLKSRIALQSKFPNVAPKKGKAQANAVNSVSSPSDGIDEAEAASLRNQLLAQQSTIASLTQGMASIAKYGGLTEDLFDGDVRTAVKDSTSANAVIQTVCHDGIVAGINYKPRYSPLYCDTTHKLNKSKKLQAMMDTGAGVIVLMGENVFATLDKDNCITHTEPADPSVELQSVSGHDLGYERKVDGNISFQNGYLEFRGGQVCTNVDPDTLLIGMGVFTESRADIKCGDKVVEFKRPHFHDDSADGPLTVDFVRDFGVSAVIPEADQDNINKDTALKARIAYNVFNGFPKGTSATLAAVMHSSCGVAGWAKYFDQMPLESKLAAIESHTRTGDGKRIPTVIPLLEADWEPRKVPPKSLKSGGNTEVDECKLVSGTSSAQEERASAKPEDKGARPKGKRTHLPMANVWSSSVMAVVSIMVAVAGVCGAGVWPGAIPEPMVDWDLNQFCKVEGITINSTISQSFSDGYSDVFGGDSSLLEATNYDYEYKDGMSTITATRTVNQAELKGTTISDVAAAQRVAPTVWHDRHKYILPYDEGDLANTTVEEFKALNVPLTTAQQKQAIAAIHEERSKYAVASEIAIQDNGWDLDRSWRSAKRAVNSAIANTEQNREEAPSSKDPTGAARRNSESSIERDPLDNAIHNRLNERGFALQDKCELRQGNVICAVLHEDDSNKPLWDRMELEKNPWACNNKTLLNRTLESCKELFDFEKIKPPFVTPDGKVYEIAIDLTDDQPIVRRAWRLAPKQLEKLDTHLNKLLAAGYIYPIDDSNYSAVTVLVKKPGRPGELRVTTDYRKLNEKVRKFAFMSPTAQELFNMTAGAEIFSVVDVKDAFYCMQVKKGDQHKLAFSTHRGMFTYSRMPQGFCNSPSALAAAFTRMMMEPIPGPCKEYPNGVGPKEVWGKPALGNIAILFVDDVCIFGQKQHHADCLDFVFKLMQRCNLSLRPDKCELGAEKVKYLGVILSKEGLRINPEKVEALHQAPRPTNPAGVRRFLGQAGFHRNWIPRYAHNTRHMTDLLRKGTKWEWDERHNKEYDYILKQMASGRCLSVFSWGLPVTVRTDASSVGYGATLIQHHGKERKVVCYASKRLNDTESKRCARDLECAALVWAISKFRPLLMHRPFTAEGDHEPLRWLKQYQGNNRRLFNYSLMLSDYDFRWVYRKGISLDDADHLSRHPGALLKTDQYNPDASFDAECGTDIVTNKFGEGMNQVPPVSSKTHQSAMAITTQAGDTHAASARPRVPTVHVVFYRNDAEGNLEVLTGKETKPSRLNQFNVPGGKIEAGETALEAIRRECKEEADLEFGHTALGTASKLQLEIKGIKYDTHVYLVRLEQGQNVKHATRGSGKNPLRDVKWRKVADLLKAFHMSQVLRWACHQRLVSNTREPYVQPPALQPPYLAPFFGRDVPCTCKAKCKPNKISEWSKEGYSCRKPYSYVLTNQSDAPWRQGTDGVYRHDAPTPPADEPGVYRVYTLNGGIGVDEMALKHSHGLAVRGGYESDPVARKLFKERTGVRLEATPEAMMKQFRSESGTPMPVDVLAVNAKLVSTELHPEYQLEEDNVLNLAIDMVKTTSPAVVYVTIPTPTHPIKLAKPASKQYYDLERALHKAGYQVDAKIVSSARIGGLTSQVAYKCIAHKLSTAMEWPTELKKFGGIDHILLPNADLRLRRDDFQRDAEVKDNGEFQPRKVGISHGGGESTCTRVHDHNFPLPVATKDFNFLTKENGGGCVTQNGGARVLLQTELMRAKGFTEETIAQLVEHPGKMVQQQLADTTCATTKNKVYEGILKLLLQKDLVKTETQWGTDPVPCAACYSPRMSTDTWLAGMIGAGYDAVKRVVSSVIGGVLQHTVMPSFREIRYAQRNDPKLRVLYDYVKRCEADTEFQPGTKPDNKELRMARDAIDPLYRRHAEFFHLTDDALMFRDVLNDEWLTDAVVLPETLVTTAMEAFHDSAYGAHLGPHKTRVAMQERVWFPTMKARIKNYCDNCGVCKMSKVIKRTHAGGMKSSYYCNMFEAWAVDLQGPYLESHDGMKYHLHMVCLTTKWNISIALPDKKARTVVDAIHKHLIIGGPMCTPKTLLHDNGSEFTSALTAEFEQQYGIKGIFCTVAHPTGNSVVERQHRVYNAILRSFCHKYGKDWSEALPYAVHAINTHAIGNSNITPYELVYGTKPVDPNSLACEVPKATLWKVQGGPKFLSDKEYMKLKRMRQSEVRDDIITESIDQVRQNQCAIRMAQYSFKYGVGDLLMRWTANPQIGQYGKLAYKSTGPYEVVALHQRNPDVYYLKPLGKPETDATAHHVRELCPYITREAHERQASDSVEQDTDSMLDVEVGNYLLLPNGRRQFLTLVKKVEGPYLTVQYLNTHTPQDDNLSNLNLAWWRQNPSSTEEDMQEIYAATLTSQQVADGYEPWQEKIHVNYFHQKVLTDKDLQLKKFKHDGRQRAGITLSKLKRNGVKKAKPLTGF